MIVNKNKWIYNGLGIEMHLLMFDRWLFIDDNSLNEYNYSFKAVNIKIISDVTQNTYR